MGFTSIGTGIISGLISSISFLLLLRMIRPNIKISKIIASQYMEVDGNDVKMYTFKIVNKSFFFKVYDLTINAFTCIPISNINGNDISHHVIALKGNNQWILNRLNKKHVFQDWISGQNTLTSRTDYAVQFYTTENIPQFLKDSSYITLQVLAKHSLTGFSRVILMNFHHTSKVQKGTFLSGNSLKIVQSPEINKTIL